MPFAGKVFRKLFDRNMLIAHSAINSDVNWLTVMQPLWTSLSFWPSSRWAEPHYPAFSAMKKTTQARFLGQVFWCK